MSCAPTSVSYAIDSLCFPISLFPFWGVRVLLLRDYLAAWLPLHCVGLRVSTADSYARVVRELCDAGRGLPLAASARQLAGLYADRLRCGQYRTAQLMYAVLHMALADAYADHAIDVLPDLRRYAPRYRAPCTAHLGAADASLLLGAAAQHRAAWALMLGAGLRRGEVAALTWADISPDGVVHVRRTLNRIDGRVVVGAPKSASGVRDVPMCGLPVEVLRAHRRAQGCIALSAYVCTPDGRRLSDPRRLNAWLLADAAAVGLGHVAPHQLRHTYAAAAVTAGVELRVLQVLLGHEDCAVTARVYAHCDTAPMLAAARRIGDAWAL